MTDLINYPNAQKAPNTNKRARSLFVLLLSSSLCVRRPLSNVRLFCVASPPPPLSFLNRPLQSGGGCHEALEPHLSECVFIWPGSGFGQDAVDRATLPRAPIRAAYKPPRPAQMAIHRSGDCGGNVLRCIQMLELNYTCMPTTSHVGGGGLCQIHPSIKSCLEHLACTSPMKQQGRDWLMPRCVSL